MDRTLSCEVSDFRTVTNSTSSLIGAIVVKTNEVSFTVFKANRAVDELTTYAVPVNDVQHLPEGRAEQDPVTILRAVRECISNTVSMSGDGDVTSGRVVTVGLATRRNAVVAWNKSTGVPLCNAILDNDNRTSALADEFLRTQDSSRFRSVYGAPFNPGFGAFKIKWLIENDTEVKTAHENGVCYFGTLDAWLLWNLTGGIDGGMFVTDFTNAAYTFLMNVNTLDWDNMVVNFFGISPHCLPKIKTSCEVYGKFSEGPLKDTPISCAIENRKVTVIGDRCIRLGLTNDTQGYIMRILSDIIYADCMRVINLDFMIAFGVAIVAGNAPEINAWKFVCETKDSDNTFKANLRFEDEERRISDWRRAKHLSALQPLGELNPVQLPKMELSPKINISVNINKTPSESSTDIPNPHLEERGFSFPSMAIIAIPFLGIILYVWSQLA